MALVTVEKLSYKVPQGPGLASGNPHPKAGEQKPTASPASRPGKGKKKGKSKRQQLLRGVTFELDEGELLCLMGSSGSGKSTLLRLLNRLIEPTSGQITAFGKPLEAYPPRELRRKLALVPQTPYGLPGTVRQNLLAPTYFAHRPAPDVEALMQLSGLNPELLGRLPETLSVGERQRMCLARALALDPPCLLLDEPTSALDPDTTLDIEALVKRLCHSEGKSVLFVTHSPQQAERVADRLIVLQEGLITASGQVHEVLESVLPTWVEESPHND